MLDWPRWMASCWITVKPQSEILKPLRALRRRNLLLFKGEQAWSNVHVRPGSAVHQEPCNH